MNKQPSSHHLTAWGLVLTFAAVILYLVSKGRFSMAGLTVALMAFLTLFRRPDLWWMAAIITTNSNIRLIVNSNHLTKVLLIGFIAVSIATQIFRAGRSVNSYVARTACFALVCNLVIIMSQRGWGLRFLGSSSWGGMQSIFLLCALLFYIYSPGIEISEKNMWKSVRCFLLFSLLPAGLFLLVHYVPPMGWLDRVVAISFDNLEVQQDAVPGAIRRWQIMEYPAIWMGIFALLAYDRSYRLNRVSVSALCCSVFFLILSGHRTVVVLLSLTFLCYLFVRFKQIPQGVRIRLMTVLLVTLFFLYAFARYLPLGFQRTVSWLPGIQVDILAGLSATGTSEWRIELWREMLKMVPEYLWLGRGIGFDLKEAYLAYTLSSDRVNAHQFFISIHNYHNGPLWFLIDLGLPGLLAGLFFMIGGILRYWRRLKTIPDGTFWRSAYVTFYSLFVGYCVFFFTVIGGVSYFIHLLIIASILEVINRSAPTEGSAAPGVRPINKWAQTHNNKKGACDKNCRINDLL